MYAKQTSHRAATFPKNNVVADLVFERSRPSSPPGPQSFENMSAPRNSAPKGIRSDVTASVFKATKKQSRAERPGRPSPRIEAIDPSTGLAEA